MSRVDEIWQWARHDGVVAVRVVYPSGGSTSYLTEAGKKEPTLKIILYGDEEYKVFNLFRYPEIYSPTVKKYFNKKFLDDEDYRNAYWYNLYAIREELRQQFKQQLYTEAEAILTVQLPEELGKKVVDIGVPSEKRGEVEQKEAKPLYKSRTIIGNILAVLVVVLASLAGLKLSEEQAAETVALVFAMLNMFFRAISDKPIR